MRPLRIHEALEERCLLTVTPFESPRTIVADDILRAPTRGELVDLDGDGWNDIFLETYGGLLWMRQTADGFESKSREIDSSQAGRLGDLNGDGIADVMGIGMRDLAPTVNDGHGVFTTYAWSSSTSVQTGKDAKSLSLVDMDGDGDLDATFIARWSRDFNGLGWSANDGTGRFGTFRGLIPLDSPFAHIFDDAVVFDIDTDGDMDAVTLAQPTAQDPALTWYENTPNGYQPHAIAIDGRLDIDFQLDTTDANGDGRLEVVISKPVSNGIATTPRVLSFDTAARTFVPMTAFPFDVAAQIAFADLDGDGDNDLIRSIDRHIEWYERTAQGDFAATPNVIGSLTTGPVDSFSIGDANQDGHPDVVAVSRSFDTVVLFINGEQTQFTANSVIESTVDEIKAVYAADLNHDGRMDVLVKGRQLSWLPNVGDGRFGAAMRISAATTSDLQVADIDDDGDLDIATADDEGLLLLRNDGSGQFTAETLGNRSGLVHVIDWDGDGDLDLLTTTGRYSGEGAQLRWHENLGNGSFGSTQLLADLSTHPIFPQDDVFDILTSFSSISKMVEVRVKDERMQLGLLLENYLFDVWGVLLIGRDTDGSFITSPTVDNVRSDDTSMNFSVVDSDADGFDEIVTLLEGDEYLRRTWSDVLVDSVKQRPIEQLLAYADQHVTYDVSSILQNGDFWRTVGNRQMASFSGGLTDLDGDGDLDRLISNRSAIYWSRNVGDARDWNQDGKVDTGDIDLLSAAIAAQSSDAVFDINGDEQVDTNDLDQMLRIELNSSRADVNLDRVFDSSDLVKLFQIGKYDTGASAVWSEGDFNGDGHFDSADLVVVFMQGIGNGFSQSRD
ncbi:MAG: VCBS repeat-containing protein [Planctomycetales bacterium]|nr:VCBS repeat-containing protein [Planctomycetales bacterium]